MDRFALTDDLLTNMPDIDAQHRKLFELVNQVVDPSTIGRGTEFFLKVLDFLTGYVSYHFAAEEIAMRELRYPRYDLHRHWHDTFRVEVGTLVGAARSNGVSTALKQNLAFTVENWLLDHIRVTDRHFAEYVIAQSKGQVMALPNMQTIKAAGAVPADYVEPTVGDEPTT